jgi:hypothetical protein
MGPGAEAGDVGLADVRHYQASKGWHEMKLQAPLRLGLGPRLLPVLGVLRDAASRGPGSNGLQSRRSPQSPPIRARSWCVRQR